jgi:hypothetical protein
MTMSKDPLDLINRLPESFDEPSVSLEDEVGNRPPVNIVPFVPPEETEDEQSDDEALARAAIRNVIKKSSDALDDAARIVKETDHPRALEVFATLASAVAGAAKDLLEVAKSKKELNTESPTNPGGTHIENAVFVGTTEELQKMLAKARAPKQLEHDNAITIDQKS